MAIINSARRQKLFGSSLPNASFIPSPSLVRHRGACLPAAAGRGDLDLMPQHSVGATADKLRSNAERYQMRAKPVTRCGSVERCV
jgi:hypothetical protein